VHITYTGFSVLAVNIGTQSNRLLQWSIFESGYTGIFSYHSRTQRRSVYPIIVKCLSHK